MRRTLAIGFGLLEAVAPRSIIERSERLAFENPEDGRLRPWTVPIARLEGLVFAWLFVRERESPALRTLLIVGGAVMALAPRSITAAGLSLAYENAAELELKRWVVPATRLLGAVYLAAGLFSVRAKARSESTTDALEDAR